MRFFILLTVLLALVSCDSQQKPITGPVMDAMLDEPDEFPEITISPVHQALQPGTYRIILNGFEQRHSRLQSVYISSGSGDVLDVLRIKFNPQPWIFTEDNELVVRLGEEIVVGINSGPKTFTEELGTETRNVIEYEGIAIANLTRSNIIFQASPSVASDGDDDVPPQRDDDDDNEDDVPPRRDDDDEDDGEEPPPTDPVTPMPDGIETLDNHQRAALQKFGKNDKVTVKNTLNIGLRIRNAPDGTRIGGMFDGETGTIISDPEIANGYVWFEIEWDRPVKNPNSGCGDRDVCVGWSVAVIRDGTEVLDLQR